MAFFCKNILSIIVDMLYFVRKHKGRPACLPLEKKQTVPLAKRDEQRSCGGRLNKRVIYSATVGAGSARPKIVQCIINRRGRPVCLPETCYTNNSG